MKLLSNNLTLGILLSITGIFAGIFIDKILLLALSKLAKRTKFALDDIVINSLKGISFFILSSTGIYLGILQFNLTSTLQNSINKLFVILIILSITILVSRIVSGLVKNYSKQIEGIVPPTSIFVNVTRTIIFIISTLIILQWLGISITPLLTALGVGGLAVALALQDTLSNLFSGLHIIISRKIKPGDFIKLDSGEQGYITDIGWRSTTIKALPNNIVVIPNSKLAQAIITNFYLPEKEIAFSIDIGVSYSSDLEKVEKVTKEVAKEIMKTVPGGVPTFEPVVRYHTFGDFSINFTVIMRAKEFVDQYSVKHEFIKKLHERYKKEGIEIPFPIRTIYTK